MNNIAINKIRTRPRKPKHDKVTEDFFQPRCEPASLFGNDVKHMPEPATILPDAKIATTQTMADDIDAMIATVETEWAEFAAEVAAKHSGRDPVCECGACRFARKDGA